MVSSSLTAGVTVAVDPGIRGSGVALFRGNGLVWAGYVENPLAGNDARAAGAMAQAIKYATHRIAAAHVLCVEMPVVRDARHSKGDPNDLIPLAAINGALYVWYCGLHDAEDCRLVQYKPEEWKGQLSKEAMNARTLSRLGASELECVQGYGALTHNVHDAVGIGLHFLGRLKPTRAYPRL